MSDPTRVVIAPDSFKGTLSAREAAEAFARGWRSVEADARLELHPMADGGEGTLEAFAHLPGAQRHTAPAEGPDGVVRDAPWLSFPDPADGVLTGVVELAAASGIELLEGRLRPWEAHTLGFGQVIAAALEHGVERLLLAIGSSASTDGGLGMLLALGAHALDPHGHPVVAGARGLVDLARLDLADLRRVPASGVRVLCDVRNPLLGPTGAAAVFGPQKGLLGQDAELVDAALARYAALVSEAARTATASTTGPSAAAVSPETPGAGAAGGTGFALLAWGAALVSGAEEVARVTGLDAALRPSAPDPAAAPGSASPERLVVMTGEGSFDGQTAGGKGPARVIEAAERLGAELVLVAGRVQSGVVLPAGTRVVDLTELAGSAEAAMATPARWIEQAGRRAAGVPDPDC